MQVLCDVSRNFKVHINPQKALPRLLVVWDGGKAALDLESWNVAESTKGLPPEELLEWLKANASYLWRWLAILQMGFRLEKTLRQ